MSKLTVILLGVILLGAGCKPKLADTVQQVRGSVVHVTKVGEWEGSGFVVSEDGLIVTAKHVVEGGGTFVVTFDDGSKVTTTQALQDNLYDVGFLKVEKKGLKALPLSNSVPRPGESIFVMGSPLGFEQFNSVTLGIVSAAQRDWDKESEGLGWKVLIQEDAPGVYPGNSGGPVFNMRGEVIGVLVAGAGPGLSCSVPVKVFANNLYQIRLAMDLQRFSDPSISDLQKEITSLQYQLDKLTDIVATLAQWVAEQNEQNMPELIDDTGSEDK